MVLKKELAGSWDKQWAWVGSRGWPRRSCGGEPAWLPRTLAVPSWSPSCKCPTQTTVLVFGQLRASWVAGLPLGMPSPGSRDACHGRLRGPGRRECWISAAGGQGNLVEPACGLLGVRGGSGASDSQKIPRDRYLGRLGDCVNPSSDACEARRGRSPNRVFQARARRGKKKLAAPTGPGTCECRGSSPLFFISRGSSGPHLALQPHLCVPSLPRPIPLAVKGRGN